MFNARPGLGEHYRRYEGEIESAYRLACEGIDQGDLEKLASAGTLSARCNLEINPKIFFEPFLAWVREKGGLGVVTAHSGTLLAGVFPQNDYFNRKVRKNLQLEAQQRFAPAYLDLFQSQSGGIVATNVGITENMG